MTPMTPEELQKLAPPDLHLRNGEHPTRGSIRLSAEMDAWVTRVMAAWPAIEKAVAESAKHPEQPKDRTLIGAQHDETGRLWRGQRCDLPQRYAEVPEQPKVAPEGDDLIARLRALARAEHDDLSTGEEAADYIEHANASYDSLVAESASQAERIEVLERLLREAQGHVKGHTMSMLARSSRRLSAAIDAALTLRDKES